MHKLLIDKNIIYTYSGHTYKFQENKPKGNISVQSTKLKGTQTWRTQTTLSSLTGQRRTKRLFFFKVFSVVCDTLSNAFYPHLKHVTEPSTI